MKMGNLKEISNKSLQHLYEESQTVSSRTNTKPSKNAQQVFLQQSVTLLALKDKASVSSTVAPDLHPKLLFGVVPEDLPLFIGAIIGASLVIGVCVIILLIWKCCCRMTVLSKKKQYWLQPKGSSSTTKGKFRLPVVQSNSVVFLGLKPTQAFDYKRERSSEECIITKFVSNSSNEATAFGNPLHFAMSEQCPEIIVSGTEKFQSKEPVNLSNTTFSESFVSQPCAVISASPILDRKNTQNRLTKLSILSAKDVTVPSVTIHQDSPDLYHRSFHSGSFDQHSLYSCDSHIGYEFDFKKSNYTWSNFSLRPGSTSDSYYDLFQKANFCKKRKNRMRSDIAAAIAMNRSQSPQTNKDTDLLVENAVEVILDQRTTL